MEQNVIEFEVYVNDGSRWIKCDPYYYVYQTSGWVKCVPSSVLNISERRHDDGLQKA